VTRIYHLTGKDIAETKKYSRHKSLANLDYYIGTTQDLPLRLRNNGVVSVTVRPDC